MKPLPIRRLLIDYSDEVVRTALLEDRKLKEIFIDYKDKGSIVGYIINGIVKNILPSKFAFIDIGQEKNAFMNLSPDSPLKSGQYIPVQVRKDASGDKGANVSEILHFNGRFVIIYPSKAQEIGVSQKIADKTERKRLQQIALKFLPKEYSVIMRTQSKGISEEEIQAEFEKLTAKCNVVLEEAKYATAPKILYQDNYILKDFSGINEIIVNDAKALPQFNGQATLWEGEQDLFEAFDVERQINKALQRNVWLPCGGFVTIDQVEACVVIDVNTGKFMGKRNYRETILKTNLEAAECIAEQIMLRNLSGMIIVDFIDMPDESDKNKLIAVFSQHLKKDRIPADIIGMTPIGLVQLTRRKQREPLNRLLQQPCPCCKGVGRMNMVIKAGMDKAFKE